MKLSICVLLGLLYCNAVLGEDQKEVLQKKFSIRYRGPPKQLTSRASREKWGNFTAKVDNFDPLNTKTYKMRYLQNLEFCFTANCPIIIYLGGEWEIGPGSLTSGQMYALGDENGAALFYTEHRYYGKSWPTSNFTTKNLKYLSSQQAIEDIRNFILYIKASNPKFANSKVVLLGCSYSASLTAWVKVTYPDLITATYSSSGPLEAKADMFEYLEVATRLFSNANQDCINTIQNGITALEQLYADQGGNYVRNLLNVCAPESPIEPYDKMALFESLILSLTSNVQGSPDQISSQCDTILNTTGDSDMDKIANYYMSSGSCSAVDYAAQRDSYTSDLSLAKDDRPWLYQQCMEFGWFLTSHSDQQSFGSSLLVDFWYKLCSDAFNRMTGEQINQNMQATNKRYGGKNPNIHQAVFLYGGIDPWAPLGLTQDLSDDAKVFYIDANDASHCADLSDESSSDSENMAYAKKTSRGWIGYWLSL